MALLTGGSNYQVALDYVVEKFMALIIGDATRVLPCAINATDTDEFVTFWGTAFEIARWKMDPQIPIYSSLGFITTLQPSSGKLSGRELKLWDAVSQNRVNVVREYLHARGLDVNFCNPMSSMNTLLHLACEKGHVGIVFELLKCASIDMNKVNQHHMTPLSLACRCAQIEVACLLLRDPRVNISNVYDEGLTPLQIASLRGKMARVLYIAVATGRSLVFEREAFGWVTQTVFVAQKQSPTISYPLSLEDWSIAEFEGLGTIERELGISFEIFGQSTDFRSPFVLNLCGIGLRNLSGGISSFRHLTILTLRGNYLRDLPGEVNSLPLLISLDVAENMLTGLGGHLTCLDRLTELNVSENLIGEAEMLPVLQHGKKLVKLDISGNPLGHSKIAMEVAAFIKGHLCLTFLQLEHIPLDSKGCAAIIRSLEWNYSEGIIALRTLG